MFYEDFRIGQSANLAASITAMARRHKASVDALWRAPLRRFAAEA